MSSSGDNYGGGGNWSSDPWGQGGGQDQWGQGGEQGNQPWVQPTQEWGGGQPGQPSQPGQQQWGAPGQQQWGGGQPGQPSQPGQQQWGGGQPGQPSQPGQGQWGALGQLPPSQPGQQWGAPGQPPPGQSGQQWGPPGQQPPFQPPRKSNKGLLIGLLSGGGAVVIIIIVVIVLLVRSGGGGGDDATGGGGGGGVGNGGDRKVAWSIPEPDSESAATLLNAYVVKDTVVRASGKGLIGYGLADGKQKWTLSVPAGNKVCAAAPSAPDNIAAVVFGSDRHCTTVAAVNLATGKQVWTATPKVQSSIKPTDAGLAAAGGKIYVSNTEAVWAYDAKTGKQQWAKGPKGKYCSTGDVVADDKGILVTVSCSLDNKFSVAALNPDSGNAIWQTPIKTDEDFPHTQIVSVSPPVVHVDDASDNGELRVFNDKGKQTFVIPSRGSGGDLGLSPDYGGSFDDLHRVFPVNVVGTTLVALVDNGSDTESNEKAVGVNLTTGKRAWVKDLKSSNQFGMVHSTDPKQVLVIDAGDYDADPQLDAINAQNGSVTKGDTLAKPKSLTFFSVSSTKFVSSGDTLFQLKSSSSGDEPIVIAYK